MLLVHSEERVSSFFYRQYVSTKLHHSQTDDADLFAWNHPVRYPIINGTYCLETIEPQIDWAQKYAATRKYPKRWKCLGVFVCPECDYRLRPQAPRFGKGKYSSQGKIRDPSQQGRCPSHEDIDLVHMDSGEGKVISSSTK